jgi:hypothetical protein
MTGPERTLSLPTIVGTLRSFLVQSGGEHAVLALDQGDDAPTALVELGRRGSVEISEGEDTVVIPDPAHLAAESLPLPDVRPMPPLDVDAISGEVRGPIGAFDHLGRAVRDLAALFPGRSAVTVTFASANPELPLTLAARRGEPLALQLGEVIFELPEGWPR